MKGGLSNYLSFIGMLPANESRRLSAYRAKYANLLPYRTLVSNIAEQTGSAIYSPSQTQSKIQVTARAMSEWQASQYAGVQLCLPFVDPEPAIYDPEAEEVVLMEDGIGVKRQKDKRKDDTYEKSTKRVPTDVIALSLPDRSTRYLSPLMPQKATNVPSLSLTEQLHAEWSIHYGGQTVPLVILSDGARSIRNRYQALFGNKVQIILDWFHLKKRINELCSMMGLAKIDKQGHIQQILQYLWQGKYDHAMTYIRTELHPISQRVYKKEELLTYLAKHKKELIHYERRQAAGKPVGSGKIETTANLIVGKRQKSKGMSWTIAGSRALAVIKTLQLNDQFDTFWQQYQAA